MKTAICIDSLIARDELTFLLELVLNIFPNSEIYTIAHKQGGILGPVETRPIVSSFLTHMAKDESVFEKKFWLLPSAVKGIPMHKSIEKVIVLSRGYIQGLNFPPHVKSYLYIYDWDLVDQKHLGWQKFFKAHNNHWREKAFPRFRKIAVSSEALRDELSLPNAELIHPTFRTEEYPFVKDEDHNFLFTHHLVLTHGLSVIEFRNIAKVLVEKKETVRVMGPDQHLEAVRKEFPQLEFAGDHCEATTAMYSHQAKAVWALEDTTFPSQALGALCTGRPVVVRDTRPNREYLVKGSHFLKGFSEQDVAAMHFEVEASFLSHDRRELRRLGLKWNERLFKSRMVSFLERATDDAKT